MPAKNATPPATPDACWPTAYVLRIELRELTPVIWREVWVAPDITLRKLHGVIQAAMGWHDCHLYGFGVPGRGRAAHFWGVPSLYRFEPRAARDRMDLREPANDDASTALSQVLRAPKDKLLYLYDFGDDWEHLITLQKIVTTPEPLPLLARAAYTCPPESCGGVPGFLNLAQALHDPNHPEHADLRAWVDDAVARDWLPGELDPAAFKAHASAVARLRPRAPLRRL